MVYPFGVVKEINRCDTVKYTNINCAAGSCFGFHEVVEGPELVFILHSDGFENL
jgi:hypothetical protein